MENRVFCDSEEVSRSKASFAEAQVRSFTFFGVQYRAGEALGIVVTVCYILFSLTDNFVWVGVGFGVILSRISVTLG